MRELSMRFLGAPELTLDNEPVHLPRQRSLALLAYLAITGRPHTRDELAALLSGEAVGSQERKLLRNALTTLTEQLGDYLLTSRQTIAFNAALPHRLDVAALDALLADGASPDPAALERAVAHFDQELLAGLSLRDAPLFESWLLRARARVRQQLTQAAHRLLEDALRRDALAQGIATARRVLAVEPWQEGLQCQLMRLLARDGQRAAALAQYDECRQALAAELGVDPQPETTALYERLRGLPFVPRHNLPEPASPLIGREAELAEVARLLADPACRLVAVVGLGGSGKTRLALAAAVRCAAPVPLAEDHPFPDGCFLVDLAGIAGAGAGPEAAATAERRIALAVGLALGLVYYGHLDRLDQLVAYLAAKRLLLVLDGLERLVAGERALQAILRGAPGVTLLATSRTHLALPEAHVRTLGRLDLPAGPDDLERAPASQLFLREAQRLNARLAPADWPHIASICRQVDGLPLALIIAAGWSRALSCAEIARDLEQGLKLLDGSARRRSDGHESLGAIIAFAWRSLSPGDRRALRHLAVFHGHFDRPAYEAVGVSSSTLFALRDQSLVERDGRDGYALPRLVRQYGLAQLARRPAEEARLHARHATYYATLIARTAEGLFERPEAHAIISADRANALAAWEWAVEHLDLGLIAQLRVGLSNWHQMAGLHHEWSTALEQAVLTLRAALADHDDPALRVTLGWLLAAKADAYLEQRDPDRAFPLLVEARQCARAVGMIPLEAQVAHSEGRIRLNRGEYHAAREALQQSLALARAIQARRLEAQALTALAIAAIDVGQFAEAEAQLTLAEQAYFEVGDRLAAGRVAIHRARIDIEWGDFVRARAVLEQSLPLTQSFGDRPRELQAHMFLGMICDSGWGRHREADEHYERGVGITLEIGDRRAGALLCWGKGRNALHAGDFVRAELHCDEAIRGARAVGSPYVVGRALQSLGQLAHARGDANSAEDLAQQALRIALDAGQRQGQATALLLLGQAREQLGLLPEATAAYGQALALARELSMPALRCDAEAGLASVELDEGRIGDALPHAAAIFTYLETQGLAGCEEPGRVALTCFRAFRAARDARDQDTLRLGAIVLERRIAALPPGDRTRYVAAFPARHELLAAWHEHQGAPLRRAGVPISLVPPPSAPVRGDHLDDDGMAASGPQASAR